VLVGFGNQFIALPRIFREEI